LYEKCALGRRTHRGEIIKNNQKVARKWAAEDSAKSLPGVHTPYGWRSLAWLKSDAFLESREWKDFRYRVLKQRKPICELCGATRKDGTIIQVDHIKPRSTYPQLALERSNAQILCDPCNLGKGADDQTDWR